MTTFRTQGAHAIKLYHLDTLDDVVQFVQDVVSTTHDWFILGGGSNVLLTRSVEHVARIELSGYQVIEENDTSVLIRIEAGAEWHACVEWAVQNGWGGIEAMALIPGSVGAAPIQNIGAYGQQLSDTCQWVEYVTIPEGNHVVLPSEQCGFGYRDSIFKHALYRKIIITAVAIRLDKTIHPTISYAELKQALDHIEHPTIKDVFECVMHLRTQKLPPVHLGSAGSFFKNPVVSQLEAQRLLAMYPTMPYYPNEGIVKLSAGWLIEQCGFKGIRRNNVGVYHNHALVLVNYGDAHGSEVLHLAREIQSEVYRRFGIFLEEEVVVV